MGDEYLELLKRTLTGCVYPESAYRYITPLRVGGLIGMLKSGIVRFMGSRGYRIVKVQQFDAKAREDGRDWPSIGYTMVGLRRLSNVQDCIETVIRDAIAGDLCETGVWRGGCAMFMRAVLKAHGITDRIVWAADSFEGLPRPDAVNSPADKGYDLSQIDYLSVPLDVVKANFCRFGLLDDRVKFLKGWFKDSLPIAPIERLSVLRLDGDLYESTMDALVPLYDKVSPGGFVIVDDYGSWEPCRRAVDDFRKQRGITDPIHVVDWTGVFWRKT